MMKKIFAFATTFLIFIGNANAAEVLCEGAYIDTIAVESTRAANASEISQALLISFKKNGTFYNCDGAFNRYVYIKASESEAIFNAMTSLAFMAKASNYKVDVMIDTSKTIYSATKLAYMQIVDESTLPAIVEQ